MTTNDGDGLRSRVELADLLPTGAVVIELGVARGEFSEQMLDRRRDVTLYAIDAWRDPERGHHDDEHAQAQNRLSRFGDRAVIVRSFFHDAVLLFRDGFADLVYVDGYAHLGQDAGQTMHLWWPKVKPHGIMAGHDYHHARWPFNVEMVDGFCRSVKRKLSVISEYDQDKLQFPSWWIRK
jgi:hypothetical protein